MYEPIVWSWPSCRAALKEVVSKLSQDGDDSQVSSQQLHSWIHSLEFAGGELLVSADTLEMLPGRIPYEVFGACLLAAVDSHAAAAEQHVVSSSNTGSEAVEQSQRQQQHVALKLHRIDLQEPFTGPLTTCFTGYPLLQHLSLQELNVDVEAAAALGNILQHTACTPSCLQGNRADSSDSSGGMRSLTLHSVFLCQLAWRGLFRGLSTRCHLRTLRLRDCLTISSLTILAHALPEGCSSLRELDLSCNTLQPQQPPRGAPAFGSSCIAVESSCDKAWAQFLTAFEVASCCPHLHVLVLDKCSLGPSAAAAATRVLRAQCRNNLQRLSLAQCQHMGQVAVKKLSAAIRHHPNLLHLDMSGTALSEECLTSMLGSSSSSISGWWRQQRACQQLRRLCLAGNSRLTAAAFAQLAKIVMSGGMAALCALDVSQCPGLGDEGALAVASCLPSPQCQLLELNMSGCEITDAGAAALAAAVGQSSSNSTVAGTPADSSINHSNSALSSGGGVSCSKLRELRLADNQITAIGLQALAQAISCRSCRLHLLDVSFNWAGPEAMLPLTLAAYQRSQLSVDRETVNSVSPVSSSKAPSSVSRQHMPYSMQQSSSSSTSQPPQLSEPLPSTTVLRECSHEWWRVEAAKATANAAAAAEAVAAAAAVGSGWDLHESDRVPVQQHPAAATALGLADSSDKGRGSCGSTMTHAGSLAGSQHTPCAGAEATGNAVWLYNGLYAAADDSNENFEYPNNTRTTACVGDTSANRWHRQFSSSTTHSVELSIYGEAMQTKVPPVECGASTGTSPGSRSLDPGLPVAVSTGAASVSATTAAAAETMSVSGASAAIRCLQIPDDGDGGGGGDGGDSGCMSDCVQQEASFSFQVYDDVVPSPTRYDQQLQEQQQHQHLKGVSWSDESLLSPPPSRAAQLHSQFCGPATAAKAASSTHNQLLPRVSADTHHPAEDSTCPAAPTSNIGQQAAAVKTDTAINLEAATAAVEVCQRHPEGSGQLSTGGLPPKRVGSDVQRASGANCLTSADRQMAAPTIRAHPPSTPRRSRCGVEVRLHSKSPRALTCAVKFKGTHPEACASHPPGVEGQAVHAQGTGASQRDVVAAGDGALLGAAVSSGVLAQRTAAAANGTAPVAPYATTWLRCLTLSDSHGALHPDLPRGTAQQAATANVAGTVPLISSLAVPGTVHPRASAAAVLQDLPSTTWPRDCSPESVKISVNGGVKSRVKGGVQISVEGGVKTPVNSSTRSARSWSLSKSIRPRISPAGCHGQHSAVAHPQQQQQQQQQPTVVPRQTGQCSTATAECDITDLHRASRSITSSLSTRAVAGRLDVIVQQELEQQQSERLLAKAMQTCNYSHLHGVKAVASSGSLWQLPQVDLQELVAKQHDSDDDDSSDDDDAGRDAQSDMHQRPMVLSTAHAGNCNHLHALPAVGG